METILFGLKKIKIIFSKKGVLISFLVSYLSVFLIPILISAFVYFEVMRIVEKETANSNISLMNQMRNSTDQLLIDIEKTSIEISIDSRFQVGFWNEDYSEGRNREAILQMANALKSYGATNTFINDIYLYSKDLDFAIGTGGSYGGRDLYLAYFENTDLPYDEWEALMTSPSNRGYYPVVEHIYSGMVKRFIMYVDGTKSNSIVNSWDMITINISQTRFEESLTELYLRNEGVAFIVDKHNNRIHAPQLTGVDFGIAYEDLLEEEDSSLKVINGKKYIISYCSSKVNDWKYVMVVPADVYMKNVSYVRRLIFYSMLICIGLGIIFVYYFSKRNYDEIKGIATLFGEIAEDESNELQFIKNKIKLTLSDPEHHKTQLEHNKAVRAKFISELLSGRGASHIPADLQSFFSRNYYLVILFQLEEYEEIFFGDMQGTNGKKIDTAFYIINNVMEELISEFSNCLIEKYNENLICICSIEEKKTNNLNEILSSVLSRAQHFTEKEFNVKFTVSISDFHTGIEGIPLAYSEAAEALQYKMILGKKAIISYDKVKSLSGNYLYTSEDESKLVNCIMLGAAEEAENIITKIFDKNFRKIIPLQMAKCFIFDIVSTLVKISTQISAQDNNQTFSGLNIVNSVLNAATLEEMKGHIIDVSKRICDYVNSLKKEQSGAIIENIKKYVDENYMDINLNISDISEHFGISAPYISRIFKTHTGENLLDYIHKVRLSVAKQLLDKNLNVNDVASQVGYTNSNSLIRWFKKYEHITPGKYKEIHEDRIKE